MHQRQRQIQRSIEALQRSFREVAVIGDRRGHERVRELHDQ
jgi:hypothetical protein